MWRGCTVLLAAALLWAWPAAGGAGQIVIYRCVDAFEQVTLQNGVPCPKGSRQERRVVEAVQGMPAFQPPPAPPTPAAPVVLPPTPVDAVTGTLDGPDSTDAEAPPLRLPPPPLYQCEAWDKTRYFSDTDEPAPRCIPLQTVGIGGHAHLGVGEACQRVTDTCQRIDEDAVCEAWADRLREAEAAWRFAPAALVRERQAEFERIRLLLQDSQCGG